MIEIRRPGDCKEVTSDYHAGMRNTELALFGLWETWDLSYEVTEDERRDTWTVKAVWGLSVKPGMTIQALRRHIHKRLKESHQNETLQDVDHILNTGRSMYDN